MICDDWDPNCPSDCPYNPVWTSNIYDDQDNLYGTEYCEKWLNPDNYRWRDDT